MMCPMYAKLRLMVANLGERGEPPVPCCPTERANAAKQPQSRSGRFFSVCTLT